MNHIAQRDRLRRPEVPDAPLADARRRLIPDGLAEQRIVRLLERSEDRQVAADTVPALLPLCGGRLNLGEGGRIGAILADCVALCARLQLLTLRVEVEKGLERAARADPSDPSRTRSDPFPATETTAPRSRQLAARALGALRGVRISSWPDKEVAPGTPGICQAGAGALENRGHASRDRSRPNPSRSVRIDG